MVNGLHSYRVFFFFFRTFMGPQSTFQSLLFIHSHTHTHTHTPHLKSSIWFLALIFHLAVVRLSGCDVDVRFSPLSMFPLIKNCSTVALDLSLTPIELRECSSSVPGVWIWDLLPANHSGTVPKNDYDRVQIIFCNVLMYIMLQKE